MHHASFFSEATLIEIGLYITGMNRKKGFIKGEALRLLRTNSEKTLNKANETLNEATHKTLVQEILTEVMFTDRNEDLRNRTKQRRFYCSLLPTTSAITPHRISKRFSRNTARDIVQQKAKLKNIYHQPPIVSNRKEKSLKGILVRAKIPSISQQSQVIKAVKKVELGTLHTITLTDS